MQTTTYLKWLTEAAMIGVEGTGAAVRGCTLAAEIWDSSCTVTTTVRLPRFLSGMA